MALYKIPVQDIPVFELIWSSPNEYIESINKGIKSLPHSMIPSKMVESIASEINVDGDDLGDILKIIYSLSLLRKEDDLDKESVIEAIVESLKETDNLFFKEITEWDSLKEKLLSLMQFEDVVSLGFKALLLSMDFDKLYVDSKIITEIRPVFEDNSELGLANSIITHSLKIEYHFSDDTHQKIFITLDSENLQELKQQIVRAEKKEQQLENSLNKYFKTK